MTQQPCQNCGHSEKEHYIYKSKELNGHCYNCACEKFVSLESHLLEKGESEKKERELIQLDQEKMKLMKEVLDIKENKCFYCEEDLTDKKFGILSRPTRLVCDSPLCTLKWLDEDKEKTKSNNISESLSDSKDFSFGQKESSSSDKPENTSSFEEPKKEYVTKEEIREILLRLIKYLPKEEQKYEIEVKNARIY